jgi:tetratricopeptide (TPR) repeat protein
LELNPSSVDALIWYAVLEAGLWGNGDRALEFITQAQRLDPRSRAVRYNAGFLLLYGGRQAEGVAVFDGMMASDPEDEGGWEGIAAALTLEGRYEEALEPAQRAVALTESPLDQAIGYLGFLYGRLGRRDEALDQIRTLDELEKDGVYVSPVSRARIYSGLSEIEDAIAWLEKAYADRCHWLLWIAWEPYYWEGISGDVRFQELMRRMDFPSRAIG